MLAAVIYPVGTLCIKKALAYGAGPMRFTFVANWVLFPFFALLLIKDHELLDTSYWWACLLAGLLHFLGIGLTYVAIRVGDVSVQTPIMGTKVLFVAMFSVLLGAGPVPWPWWVAALLSVLAIFILSKPDRLEHKNFARVKVTVIMSLSSAFIFGLCDVVIQKYSSFFGDGPFLALMFFFNGVFSCALYPFFEGRFSQISPKGWIWVFIGAFSVVCFSMLIYVALAFYGRATAINILYSARGIWSIIIVYMVGSFFGNDEAQASPRALKRRLVGATLLFLAIILVLTTEISAA